MSEDDNVINLADRRPVEAPKPVPEATPMTERQTKVSAEIWNGFSPETKSDALTHDLVSATTLALDQVGELLGKEVTDNETMEIYAAVAKVTDRFFDVVKEDSDGDS